MRQFVLSAFLAIACAPVLAEQLKLPIEVPEPAPIYCALMYRIAFEQIQGQQHQPGHDEMAAMMAQRLRRLQPVLEGLRGRPSADKDFKRLAADPDVKRDAEKVHRAASTFLRSGLRRDEVDLQFELLPCDQRYAYNR